MPKHNFNEIASNQKVIQKKLNILIPASIVNLVLGIAALYLVLG